MTPPASSTPAHTASWRASLAEFWERLFWLRVAAGLGLGVFALLVSGKHFYDEYRLGADGVGVTAILPEQLPTPPYRAGSYYPMPVRFVHPQTRQTIEISSVNVPGEVLREAAGGETVVFRYLPADPRVSDFPPHENRPWGGVVVGLVLFMASSLAALGRVGAPPAPPLAARPPGQPLSGLGVDPGELPPPLDGPLPEPLAGVEWENVAGRGRAAAPLYLYAGRDPPSPGADDPVTRPFQPVEFDPDELDPPLPAYTSMAASSGTVGTVDGWRLAHPEGPVLPMPLALKPPPPFPIPEPVSAPTTETSSDRPSEGRTGAPLAPVALPVFGIASRSVEDGAPNPEKASPSV